jgi:tripartite-type tricarboxylate transporter receptor subunit TctC
VQRLLTETHKVLNDPEVKSRMAAAGMDADLSTPEEMADMVRRDQAKWAKVIKAANIKLE